MNVWLLNIRGITESKLTQLMDSLKDYPNNLICLTETHEKFGKVNVPCGYSQIVKRRDSEDKKGGGLMILIDKNFECELTEIATESPDILCAKISRGGTEIVIFLVYMDVKDNKRNTDLQHELNVMIEQNEDNKKIILGDFNAHTGYLGSQERNKNGRYIDEMVGNHNMILLNSDDRCKGETTREENGIQSTIDFVLVCQRLYGNFINMEIDEDKQIFDLSDHCLLRTILSIVERKKITRNPLKHIEYISVKEELKEVFIEGLEDKLVNDTEIINMDRFESLICETATEKLQKKISKE